MPVETNLPKLPDRDSAWFREPHTYEYVKDVSVMEMFGFLSVADLLKQVNRGRFPPPHHTARTLGVVRHYWTFESLAVEAERREDVWLRYLNKTLKKSPES